MRARRRHHRFVRRLETEFSAQGQEYRAFSSDFSCSGLFIRTNHAFYPGTLLDVVVHLPDGRACKLKGKVRRSLKTTVVSLKNGMGIEILEKDLLYSEFMSTFQTECEDSSSDDDSVETPPVEPPEFIIVACPACTVKNKVRREKLPMGPVCGKCKAPLVR